MHSKANERIEAFRKLMKDYSIDAAIIPQTDPHMSEYIAERYQTRRWLSGFTGSAGTLLVTHDQAYVWADSRYWLQADNQLKDTCISVMKEGQPSTPTISGWLQKNLPSGSKVGIDGMLFSKASADTLRKDLAEKGITLVTDFDVIPLLWIDRPLLPDSEVFLHDEKYAGESACAKIKRVLADAQEKGADSIFIADLAEIAWILNIRSRDVKCNPVAISYLYIDNSGGMLFINPAKVSDDLSHILKEAAAIEVAPYDTVLPYLKALQDSTKVLISPTKTPITIVEALGDRAVIGESAIGDYKGCKNKVQIDGVKKAMIRDGVALVKSFMEIEKAVSEEKEITEMDIAEILTRHRKAQPMYFDDSFETIAGFGPHGAIVHYSARPDTNATITSDNLLLIDSGASYLDGTTDITRTIYLGNDCVPKEMARDFTLVLKGHIDLAMAVFPEGTSGMQLDVLARLPLWKDGKTYLHGTGHGVGHFLNVHEGPQRITYNANSVPLQPGMITSDEPGVYLSDRYGVRCENLLLTKEAFTTEFGQFLKFEVLTLFPFDLRLINCQLLSNEESEWLRNYHCYVYQQLSPYLNADERKWLAMKTDWYNVSTCTYYDYPF